MKAYLEIPLPFQLPVDSDKKVVSGFENEVLGNKYFKTKFEHFTSYVTRDKQEFDEINQTQLNITYIYNSKEEVSFDHNDLLRSIVYNCLEYVNDFLSSLRFTNELNYIKTLNIYDLPEVLLINVDNEDCLYITSPMKLIEEREELSIEEFNDAQNIRTTWENHPEIGLVDRFYSSAKHSITSENFLFAIIELQTSIEIFIRNTMRIIITQDGKKQQKSDLEIKKEIDKHNELPFRNLIEHQLSKKLDEELDFEKHAIVNEWYEKLYKLRNDIVHNGRYQFTGTDAKEAYDSYVKLRKYISTKLVDKKYLDKEGNIDLKLFKDVYSNPSKQEEIHAKLIKLGFITSENEISE